ncbi:MAG: hypothetical protein CSA81_02790 [Acidobacteria bacterium]|nr:MAG: hypothetical protein CSA81_02790 [Acidobacteriota bacterium]
MFALILVALSPLISSFSATYHLDHLNNEEHALENHQDSSHVHLVQRHSCHTHELSDILTAVFTNGKHACGNCLDIIPKLHGQNTLSDSSHRAVSHFEKERHTNGFQVLCQFTAGFTHRTGSELGLARHIQTTVLLI